LYFLQQRLLSEQAPHANYLEKQAMPEPQSNPQPGSVTFDYTIERAKVVYALLEKPAEMSDQEWAIVSDEGFRKYVAGQLKIPYVSREDMKKKAH
jgi:hypothetical protein